MGYPKSNIEGLSRFSTLEIERANSLTTEKRKIRKKQLTTLAEIK